MIPSLEMHKSGEIEIKVISSAVVEVCSVLYSKRFETREIEEFFTMKSKNLGEYRVETFVPTEPSDILIAERMREESA